MLFIQEKYQKFVFSALILVFIDILQTGQKLEATDCFLLNGIESIYRLSKKFH